jgi:competence protein ComFB
MNSEKLTKTNDEDYIMVNIVEELVKSKVNEAMLNTDICTCQLCRLNVCALTLNSLPPKYVTTKRGALLARIGLMNAEYEFNLNVQIAKALKTVKECPLH